jgi:hypothetical protein
MLEPPRTPSEYAPGFSPLGRTTRVLRSRGLLGRSGDLCSRGYRGNRGQCLLGGARRWLPGRGTLRRPRRAQGRRCTYSRIDALCPVFVLVLLVHRMCQHDYALSVLVVVGSVEG